MKTKSKPKRDRAWGIYYNGKLTEVVGGEKPGRYLSTGRKRITRNNEAQKARLALKVVFTFLAVTSIYTAFFEKMPTTVQVEAVEQETEPPSFPAEFVSADIPAGTRDLQARERSDLFVKYFGKDAKIMKAICKAENTAEDPLAIGDKHLTFWENGKLYGMSVGLCQVRILPGRNITVEQMQIPEENIKKSKEIFDSQGFNAWTCYKNKSYLRHLN